MVGGGGVDVTTAWHEGGGAEMTALGESWAAQQLTEFVAAVSECPDETRAMRAAVERAAEAIEAAFGAVVIGGRVVAVFGVPLGRVPEEALVTAASSLQTTIEAPGVGRYGAVSVGIGELADGWLLLARRASGFMPAEIGLLRTMGRVLGLVIGAVRARAEERALLEALEERNRLLDRLSRIVRSICRQVRLEEVLEAITEGASTLIDSSFASLWLRDPDDPGSLVLVAAHGLPSTAPAEGFAGEAVGDRAVAENQLVVEGIHAGPAGEDQIMIAMAAPVHEDDRAIGSLTVGSTASDRTFSPIEQEVLLAFAEHASLALTGAHLHDAIQQAQRSRDMFLATVSHELKTPLTVMMGALRTIETRYDDLSEHQRAQLLASAFERGRQLEQLIDRLLESTRAELASTSAEVNLAELVGEALGGFEHTRKLRLAAVPPLRMVVDATAVRRVIEILLENGVAHSPQGTDIGIEVHATGGWASVTVRNVGRLPTGLDPSDLFAPFRRGPEADSAGVGLGLHIAGRLASSIGGEITAGAAHGTVTFTLRFPYRPASG